MSGLRPEAMRLFYLHLHGRTFCGVPVTIEVLAGMLGRSRSTITRVLNGSRRRGPVWPRLRNLLTVEELALLDVAQCDSWNNRRVDKRPRWTAWKRRMLQRRGKGR